MWLDCTECVSRLHSYQYEGCSVEIGDNQYIVVHEEDEGDLDFYSIDCVDMSEDTGWFFDGTWSSLTDAIKEKHPSTKISSPMCSEDDDGFLGVWVRIGCGQTAMWIRVMTLCVTHWCWSDEEYH